MGELLAVFYSLNPWHSRELEKVLGRGLAGVSAERVDQTVGLAVWLDVVPEMTAMWLYGKRLPLDGVEKAIYDLLVADDALRLLSVLGHWPGLVSSRLKLGPFGPGQLLEFAWSVGAAQCAEAILRRRGGNVGVDDVVNGAGGMSSLRLAFYMANGVGEGREREMARAFLLNGHVAALAALLSVAPGPFANVNAQLLGWSLMSLNTDLAEKFVRRVEEGRGLLVWTLQAMGVWRHIDTKRLVPFRGRRNCARSVFDFVRRVIATESPALVFGLGCIFVSCDEELQLLAARAEHDRVRPATGLPGFLDFPGVPGLSEVVGTRSASQLSPGPVSSDLRSPMDSDVDLRAGSHVDLATRSDVDSAASSDVDSAASSDVQCLGVSPVRLPAASEVHSPVGSRAVRLGGELGGQSGVVMPGDANAPICVSSDEE
jgi:hypothetical protein